MLILSNWQVYHGVFNTGPLSLFNWIFSGTCAQTFAAQNRSFFNGGRTEAKTTKGRRKSRSCSLLPQCHGQSNPQPNAASLLACAAATHAMEDGCSKNGIFE